MTGFESASEMLLMDDTRVTVGPSSRVVLDRFVYDPDPGKGALVLQATVDWTDAVNEKFENNNVTSIPFGTP